MRRWAAAPERPGASETEQDVRRQLAAAIARVDDVTTALLDEALTDLGLSGREAAAAAATLTAAFAAWPLAPADLDAFEDMLAVLRRAAAPDAAREVQVIDGDGGEVLLVLAARNLPAGQLGELREAVRQVLGLAGQHAGHDQPPAKPPPREDSPQVTTGRPLRLAGAGFGRRGFPAAGAAGHRVRHDRIPVPAASWLPRRPGRPGRPPSSACWGRSKSSRPAAGTGHPPPADPAECAVPVLGAAVPAGPAARCAVGRRLAA